MKKLSHQGFSAAEGLLTLVIAGVLGFVGWYVWHNKNNTAPSNANSNNSSRVTPLEYKYSGVAVPSSWKKYSNKQYGISFSYPNTLVASGTKLDPSEGADKAEFVAVAVLKNAHEGGGGYEIGVLDTTLSDAVKTYKDSIATKILSTTDISKNGFTGVKVTDEYIQKDPKATIVTSEFFFVVRNKLYQISSVSEKDNLNPGNVKESEAFFNSIELK